MSAILTVKREAPGIELRRAPLEVVLDNQPVRSIDRHETFETPLEPGAHQLQIRSGRYTSRVESFEAADGDALNFRCHPTMLWPRYVASLIVPSLGISLKRE